MSLINVLIVVSIFHYGRCEITKAELSEVMSEVKQEILQHQSEELKGIVSLIKGRVISKGMFI